MKEIVQHFVQYHEEEKGTRQKWLAENKDLKDTTAHAFMLLGIALNDVGIAFWSSFLESKLNERQQPMQD